MGLARQRSNPEVISALDRIERKVQRLNSLIGQLLSLARLESGTETTSRELIREIVADADFEARSQNRTVQVGKAEECTTLGSTDLLRSAIENVVRNAVRHTAEGTEVEIHVRCQRESGNQFAVISVRDHGCDVPEAALPCMFQPFYRVDAARNRETGGAGLGLAITERVVRLFGGTVTATNAPGGGLLIEMRLPAMRPGGTDNSTEALATDDRGM